MISKEKVKAYLENLRKAKDLLEQISTELSGGEDASEDERTRKAILAFIKSSSDTRKLPTREYSKWIEYLEKQKNTISCYEEKLDRCVCENFNKGIREVLLHPEEYGLVKRQERKPSAEEALVRAGLQPYKDGDQWCILAGDNIQEGICGFGDTIEDALCEFLKEVLDLQRKQKPVEYLSKEKVYHIVSELANLSLSGIIPIESEGYTKIVEIKSNVLELLNYPIERKSAGWVLPEDFEEAVYKVANFISPFNQQELREVSHLFAEQLLSLAKKELNKAAQWSEGKRIRKVLISIVKWLGFDSSFFIDNSVTKREVLAWLEKQGEQVERGGCSVPANGN